MLAPCVGDLVNANDFAARLLCVAEVELGLALDTTALGAFFAHFLERADAAFVAGASSLDAFANPDLFFGEFFIEDGLLFGLSGEEFGFTY